VVLILHADVLVISINNESEAAIRVVFSGKLNGDWNVFEPESTRSLVSVVFNIYVVKKLDISSVILYGKFSELGDHFLNFSRLSSQVSDFEFIIAGSKSDFGFDID